MSRLHIAQFNDSFPPMIDGVAQVVKNYAAVLQKNHCDVTVVTPSYKDVVDNYPFEVHRYSSLPVEKKLGYRAGFAFSPLTIHQLRQQHFDLLHIHAPFASSVLANNVNRFRDIPTVLTYHTKFDIDIRKRLHSRGAQAVALRFVRHNIQQADEVWAVTKTCIQSLRALGYEGPCRVMENGTDFAYGKAPADTAQALREAHGLPEDCPIFLFVGRMMWYKNTKLILDAVHLAKRRGLPFRLLMVGDGVDLQEIRAYSDSLGLSEQVRFTGPVFDRERLRAYYTLADLFLFPSTYDTSGIVVKEAAACECPALLIRGSCAAEGAVNRVNAFLAEETPLSCGQAILDACADRETLRQVGKAAGEQLYLSWDTAVARAFARYEEILHGGK